MPPPLMQGGGSVADGLRYYSRRDFFASMSRYRQQRFTAARSDSQAICGYSDPL